VEKPLILPNSKIKKEQKVHEEWDPRKHRIHHGLKKVQIINQDFKGLGTVLG